MARRLAVALEGGPRLCKLGVIRLGDEVGDLAGDQLVGLAPEQEGCFVVNRHDLAILVVDDDSERHARLQGPKDRDVR